MSHPSGLHVLPIDPLDRVTGSSTLLHAPEHDTRVLIDCGAYQGEVDAALSNRAPFPFEAARIHCVLLTHGHYDHCGRLVDLYKSGFRGTVYATEESIALARIVLADSLKLQERRDDLHLIDRINWRSFGRSLFRKPRPIARDLFVEAYRSGHVLGAVSYVVSTGHPASSEHCRVLFSGDLGNNWRGREGQPWIRHGMVQSRPADLAVVESTYGGVLRSPEELEPRARRARLAAAVREGLARSGPVIIPVFAIQRSADLLFDLQMLMAQDGCSWGDTPLLVDGPMACRFFEVLRVALGRQHTSPSGKIRPVWLSRQSLRDLDLEPDDPSQIEAGLTILENLLRPASGPGAGLVSRWRPVQSAQRERLIAQEGARVVLCTGGMASGGPVQSWLARWLLDERATVLFTGYCCPGTLGGCLQELASLAPTERARSRRQLVLGERSVDARGVQARIERLRGYSGHADQLGLIRWCLPERLSGEVFPVSRRILVQHGDYAARSALRDSLHTALSRHGVEADVRLPERGDDAIDARTGQSVPREGVLGKPRALESRIAALRAELARLEMPPI